MEPLEDILKNISSLKQEYLYAVTVVVPEEGHYVDPHADGMCHSQDSQGNCYCDSHTWFVDKAGITEIDTSGRKQAKESLIKIHDFSEWYSARYVCGKILKIDDREHLPKWTAEMSGVFKKQYSEDKMLQTLDDALRLVELSKFEGIKNLIAEVYELGPTKQVRVKAGIELLKHQHFNWSIIVGSNQDIRYKNSVEYNKHQAKIYSHELSLGTELNPDELEKILWYGERFEDRRKVGELLHMNTADILSAQLWYNNVIGHGRSLNEDEMEKVYNSSKRREIRKFAAKEKGFSEIQFIEDEIVKWSPITAISRETTIQNYDSIQNYHDGYVEVKKVFDNSFNPDNIREAGRVLEYEESIILGRLMDTKQLTTEQIKLIYDKSGLRESRIWAGKTLGYSKIKIWWHNLGK